MKIFFVIGDLAGGGAERAVVLLSNKLSSRGHDVTIVCMPNTDDSYSIDKSVRLIKLPKYNSAFKDLFVRANNLKKVFDKYSPDIIVSFTTQKNVCVLLGTMISHHKVIVSERNDPYQDPKNKLIRFLRKMLYHRSDGFVFQTEDAKDYFSESIQLRSCVIPNPVNESISRDICERKTNKVVTVARLEPEKNTIMAIQAFERVLTKHSDYDLYIYGEGSYRDEISKYISTRHLEDKVHLEGFVSDVYDRIKDAKAFVFPSNYEGISNALMEALALGIPTVSTDHPIGGARLLIKDGETGFLVPVGDVDAMANRLELILSDQALGNRISQNSVSYIFDSFNVDRIVQMWEEYIIKIVTANN